MKDNNTTQKLSKKEQNALYYQKHKKRLQEYSRQKHYQLDKEQLREKYRAYYQDNREKMIEQTKNWQRNNVLCIKQYYQSRKTKNKENLIKFKQNYPDKYKAQVRKYNSKITSKLRTRFYSALKAQGTVKRESVVKLTGCSIAELRNYIESQWLPGMNWDNHTKTGWHIDHIIPCCVFDLTNLEQQRKCFHYSNLRPLWAKDNLSRPKNGKDIII